MADLEAILHRLTACEAEIKRLSSVDAEVRALRARIDVLERRQEPAMAPPVVSHTESKTTVTSPPDAPTTINPVATTKADIGLADTKDPTCESATITAAAASSTTASTDVDGDYTPKLSDQSPSVSTDDGYYVPSQLVQEPEENAPVRLQVLGSVDLERVAAKAFDGRTLFVSEAEWGKLQAMYFQIRQLERERQQALTSKVLPDLIRADVLKDFQPEHVRLRRLGEGNFGVVFASDFAIFKVYKDSRYLKRVHACDSQFGSFGIAQAFPIAHGYVCENVAFDWGDRKWWFNVWVENALKGVFHLDLKADNIVNNRLIDLDNYFFQGAGHSDWCMSDRRVYSKDIMKLGKFGSDWAVIQSIAPYLYPVLFFRVQAGYRYVKSGPLTPEMGAALDRRCGSDWRSENKDLFTDDTGIFEAQQVYFLENDGGPNWFALRDPELFRRNAALFAAAGTDNPCWQLPSSYPPPRLQDKPSMEMFEAAKSGDLLKVIYLAQTFGDETDQQRALFQAVGAGRYGVVHWMLSQGKVSVEQSDRGYGRNALHHAVASRQLPVLRLMVEARHIDLTKFTKGESHLLQRLAQTNMTAGDVPLIEYILEQCAPLVGHPPPEFVATPLISAVTQLPLSIVRLMVEKYGADPLEMRNKRNALEWAERMKRLDVLQFLHSHVAKSKPVA